MSAILSADDLNDFINPGIACIKPVETLPAQKPPPSTSNGDANAYEVTTEELVSANTAPPPAQISLTDCLACAGCVTSAEAVLVSLQSHQEVLDTLNRCPELRPQWLNSDVSNWRCGNEDDGKIFIASVSPQSRASLAATYNVSERVAGHMISQLLSGPFGLRGGGRHGSGFTYVVDTNAMREACLVTAADEIQTASSAPIDGQKKPLLTSACPGWICYVEKTHPHILPHLSKLKSPQALTGTLLKSVLAKKFGIPPEKIWHMAIMPCFDKKLEASRGELTSHTWHGQEGDAVRDVDCVITARELLMLAESRGISFPCLPRKPVSRQFRPPFPDAKIDRFLFGRSKKGQVLRTREEAATIGTSGGYLHHVLKTQQSLYPDSTINAQRGRNADVADYTVVAPDGTVVFKAARYYGFRNIQNLVRRLKPAKASRMPGTTTSRRPAGSARRPAANGAGGNEAEYSYVEVMACPGGCTNGGGQIKVGDVATLRQVGGTGIENGTWEQEILPAQKVWLERVDEAYWSAGSTDEESITPQASEDDDVDIRMAMGDLDGFEDKAAEMVDGIDRSNVKNLLDHWADLTGVGLDKLVYTTYRVVQSDVGQGSGGASDMERVSALAVAQGGGW